MSGEGRKGGRTLTKHVKVLDAVRPEGARVNYSIKGMPGLRLVVHPSGRKVWCGVIAVGKGATAKRTWRELGEYDRETLGPDKAHDRYREMKRQAATGELDAKSKATFGELFHLWLEKHAKSKLATWEDELRRYRMHLEKPLGSVPFAEIERKDVREVRDVVAETAGPIQSNRVVALFQRVANWAVDEDRAKFNPAARLKKVGEERRRERILSDDEIARIWAEIARPLEVDHTKGGMTEADLPAARATRRALRLLFLTGQRRGEVAGMRRGELELDAAGGAWWLLPGDRAKNGLPHRIPLSGMAVDVIREALADAGGASAQYVFPSHSGDGETLRGDAVTKALQRICKRLGVQGVGPHDIRRTIGSRLRVLGVSVEDRGHLFNHVSGAKSKVTSWNYDAGEHDDEKRRAVNMWTAELRRVTGLDVVGGNVVALARPALAG